MRRIALFLFLALSFLGTEARGQAWTFYGADSAEKVHSALVTPITSGQTITGGSPFKVAITTATGATFAKISVPFIVTCAPQAENPTTPIEEFICSAVSNDTLTLTARHLSNTTARTWAVGSYIGWRVSGLLFKQLQDSLNSLKTGGPGSGTVTSITFNSPLTGGTITSSGTVSIPAATNSANGYLTSADHTAFAAKQDPISVTAPITLFGSTIGIRTANGSQSGAISSTDWNTFNSKSGALPDSTGNSSKVLTVLPGGGFGWSTPTGSGTMTSMNVLGGSTGMSFSGGPITVAGAVTMLGTLNIANGGTGANNRALALQHLLPDSTGKTGKYLRVLAGGGFVWDTASGSGGAGSGTVTSVDVSGGSTGLTSSGGPITTNGTITLAGTLALANGGTGQVTAAAALKALTPDSTGNSGKHLAVLPGGGYGWATANAGTVTSVALTVKCIRFAYHGYWNAGCYGCIGNSKYCLCRTRWIERSSGISRSCGCGYSESRCFQDYIRYTSSRTRWNRSRHAYGSLFIRR